MIYEGKIFDEHGVISNFSISSVNTVNDGA